jgi:glucokinase
MVEFPVGGQDFGAGAAGLEAVEDGAARSLEGGELEEEHGQVAPVGAGLGLAFCKKIIYAHKGRICVESRVGEGSIFKITLPKSQPRT